MLNPFNVAGMHLFNFTEISIDVYMIARSQGGMWFFHSRIFLWTHSYIQHTPKQYEYQLDTKALREKTIILLVTLGLQSSL
jgi:hypothetical protein